MVAAGALLLVFGGVTWFLISAPGLCGDDVVKEIPSPSGEWKAVIFERSCGATTGFFTEASVLKSGKKLSDGSAGNIAVPERAWDLRWQSDRQLIVQYSRYDPPKRLTTKIGDVQVSYEQVR